MSDSNKPNPMDPVDFSQHVKRKSGSSPPSQKESKTHLAAKRRYRHSRRKRYSVVVVFLLIVGVAFAITISVYQSVQSKRTQASNEPDNASKEKFVSGIENSTSLDDVSPALKEQQPFADARLNKAQEVNRNRRSEPNDAENDRGSNETEDSVQRVRLRGVLRKAKRAIANRSFETATRLIKEARKLAGTSSEYRGQVESINVLADYSQQFWAAFYDGIATVEGSEIEVEGERMYVVECGEKKIVIRRQGKNVSLDPESLDSAMTLTIAKRGFDNSAPSTNVFIGVFMFNSPDFTDQQVRNLWQQAADEGVDTTSLMPLLEH